MSMNSQEVKNAISGVLVVDKPVGMTSHDVVDVVRRITGEPALAVEAGFEPV